MATSGAMQASGSGPAPNPATHIAPSCDTSTLPAASEPRHIACPLTGSRKLWHRASVSMSVLPRALPCTKSGLSPLARE